MPQEFFQFTKPSCPRSWWTSLDCTNYCECFFCTCSLLKSTRFRERVIHRWGAETLAGFIRRWQLKMMRACHCPLLCTRWREEGSAAFKPTACQVFRKQHWRWRWEKTVDLRSWTLAVVPLKQLIPSFFRVSSSEDYLSNSCPTGRQLGYLFSSLVYNANLLFIFQNSG